MRPSRYISPFQIFGISTGDFGTSTIRQARRRMLAEFELAGNEQSAEFNGTRLYRGEALQLLEELEDSNRSLWHKKIADNESLLNFLTLGIFPEEEKNFGVDENDKSIVDFISPYFRFQLRQILESAWGTPKKPQKTSGLRSLQLLMTRRDTEHCFDFIVADLQSKIDLMQHAWKSLRWRPHYFSEKQCETLCNEDMLQLIDQLPDQLEEIRNNYHQSLTGFIDYLISEQQNPETAEKLIDEMNRAGISNAKLDELKNSARSAAEMLNKQFKPQTAPSRKTSYKLIAGIGIMFFVFSSLIEKLNGHAVFHGATIPSFSALAVAILLSRFGGKGWKYFFHQLIIPALAGIFIYAYIRTNYPGIIDEIFPTLPVK